MDANEYANLDRVEETHWYYAGKRELVGWWIKKVRPPKETDVLLDCGAGTGRFAKEMEEYCKVIVLDDHEAALRLLKRRFPPERILSLAGDRIPLPDCTLDYITALDVLEHVPNDAAVVRGFHRLLKPNGIVVATVPADMSLWSRWDEGLHHYRRYHRAQLRALFSQPEWEILYINYTNVFVYPLVWVVRKWKDRFPGCQNAVRPEDKEPAAWINRLLRWQLVRLARVRFPMPFGVSLVLVARKRE